MPKKKRLVMAAPKFQLSYDTGKLFKYLSPEGKDKVFRAFFTWLESARKRDARYYEALPDSNGLTEIEADCLLSMVENTCEGLDNYWSRSSEQTTSDPGPPETVSDCPRLSETANKEINKGINKGMNEVLLFVPPTLDEVRDYCQTTKTTFDSDRFFNYYQARGWELRPGQPMHDWKAAVNIWEKNENKKGVSAYGTEGSNISGNVGSTAVNAERDLYHELDF